MSVEVNPHYPPKEPLWPLSLNEYQDMAETTAIYPPRHALNYLITGLCAEAGELAGKFAKAVRDNGAIIDAQVRDAILYEAGDVLWFVSEIARALKCTLEEVATKNFEKLTSRQERDALQGEGDNR